MHSLISQFTRAASLSGRRPLVKQNNLAILAVLLLSGISLLTGCAPFQSRGGKTLFWSKPAKTPPPTRIVAIWSEALYSASPPVRGFGGRLYFYDADEHPVPAEGELVVYAFDESRGSRPRSEPDRKFVFKADQLAEHRDDTSLGPSYSIWLPWDLLGGETRKISLLPVLTTPGGAQLTGSQSKNVLPGKESPRASASPDTNQAVWHDPPKTTAEPVPGIGRPTPMSGGLPVAGGMPSGPAWLGNGAVGGGPVGSNATQTATIPLNRTLSQRLVAQASGEQPTSMPQGLSVANSPQLRQRTIQGPMMDSRQPVSGLPNGGMPTNDIGNSAATTGVAPAAASMPVPDTGTNMPPAGNRHLFTPTAPWSGQTGQNQSPTSDQPGFGATTSPRMAAPPAHSAPTRYQALAAPAVPPARGRVQSPQFPLRPQSARPSSLPPGPAGAGSAAASGAPGTGY